MYVQVFDLSVFELQTETMLKTAEDLVGPYVWGVYDLLVLPPSFPYGGMENPCLTFVTPTLLVNKFSKFTITELVSRGNVRFVIESSPRNLKVPESNPTRDYWWRFSVCSDIALQSCYGFHFLSRKIRQSPREEGNCTLPFINIFVIYNSYVLVAR